MSQNMTFLASSGTFTLNDNPTKYKAYQNELDDNARTKSGALINYHNASPWKFELTFDYLGSTDYNNLLTLFNNHGDIQFYPYDEARGTALNYSTRWIGDFSFDFVDTFFTSGFTGQILMEQK